MPMMPFIGDLVAHVGEELALGLARIQRLIAGHDEILIDVLDRLACLAMAADLALQRFIALRQLMRALFDTALQDLLRTAQFCVAQLDLFEHAVEALAQGAEFVVTYLDDASTAASASPVIITIGIVVKASI